MKTLLLLIITSSCSTIFAVPRALIKRPTFEAVQKFEEYCGFSVSDVNIISMPEELFNQEIRDRVLAMCYNDPILNEKTIILIIENFYVLKDIDQRLTIYHELGHCVLDLEHTEKRNHIMHKSDAPNLTDEQALKQLCKKRKKK